MRLRTLCVMIVLGVAARAAAVDHFAENVRTTEPLTPEQEQKVLHVPPGFEMQLVASEPDIAKPINMQFDARGPAMDHAVGSNTRFPPSRDAKARDAIQVPRGFRSGWTSPQDHDVRRRAEHPHRRLCRRATAADRSTAFPTSIAFSDTDGDGQCRQARRRCIGPFGYSATRTA